MKPQKPLWIFTVLAGTSWVACTAPKSAPQAARETPPPAVEASVPPPTTQATSAFVTSTLVVRREPDDARTLPKAPGHKRAVANVVAQLQRGEQVEVTEDKDPWLGVVTSDGQKGWVRREGLLIGAEIKAATVHDTQRLFRRPDLLALANNSQVEPGALIFVLRQKDQFCQVNTHGQQTAWMLCAQLDRNAEEVDAAKLLGRARILAQQGDEGAQALEQLARTHFAQTRLVRNLFGETVAAEPNHAAEQEPKSVAPQAVPAKPLHPTEENPAPDQFNESADPGTASPRGFDSPSSGPPDFQQPVDAEHLPQDNAQR